MPKQKLDISPMVAQWGEYVSFFLFAPDVYTDGIVIEDATPTKKVALAYVAPINGMQITFDTEGSMQEQNKIIFTKEYFPVKNSETDPGNTRMLYEDATYQLIERKKYHSSYYIYSAVKEQVNAHVLS
jgi:hypothetical protein